MGHRDHVGVIWGVIRGYIGVIQGYRGCVVGLYRVKRLYHGLNCGAASCSQTPIHRQMIGFVLQEAHKIHIMFERS